jgi:hypothetical protein
LHNHHLLPKHIILWNDPINLVELTIEQHAEAHRLLWETFNYYEDYIAWRLLSGQISQEEAFLEIVSRPKSETYRKKLSKVLKNFWKGKERIPWNKGLTKEDPRVANNINKMNTRRKSYKGSGNPNSSSVLYNGKKYSCLIDAAYDNNTTVYYVQKDGERL